MEELPLIEDLSIDELNRASVEYSRDVESLKTGVVDLVNRQNQINKELARRINTDNADLSSLQADVLQLQIDVAALEASVLALTNYDTLNVASTSSSTYIPSRFQTLDVTVGVGSGTYTYDLALSTTAVEGSQFHFLVRSPAAAGRVLNIRNATTGGAILQTMTSTAVARVWTGLFIFNGTAWVKHLFTTL